MFHQTLSTWRTIVEINQGMMRISAVIPRYLLSNPSKLAMDHNKACNKTFRSNRFNLLTLGSIIRALGNNSDPILRFNKMNCFE